ncbi:aminotransferase class I/II-fold pyridoxal phosphate-dependent enzyme [Candidatus Pacearchaeota archaeon]|nr:aminotransferase class I/II-fold pyridoxal phosphate-dependent enzyme [Candidatus Pacearchaeota archaeon]
MKNRNKLNAIRGVYCYYFPEVRKVIDEVSEKFPHDVFLSSIDPGLDDFDKPIIKKFVKYYAADVPALKDFKYSYSTDGSRQGIFHLLAEIKTKNPDVVVYVLDGEYEGYSEYATRLNIKIVEVDEDEDFTKLKPGYFFISNPSGRDGNIIKNEVVEKICETHKVIYDLAYLGMTRHYAIDVSHPNVVAVVASMSKPFGMYYLRSGFTFTRKPLKTLIANKWFKNIFSLVVTDRILDRIKPGQLYKKYRPIQEKIIKEINEKHDLNLKVSDVFLLANTDDKIEEFMRGDKFCRLCLTPYLLEAEK